MRVAVRVAAVLLCAGFLGSASADDTPAPAEEGGYDAALAERVGADERGMRRYVVVVLKTGPNRVPDGEERKAMFAGHFANMERLSKEGKLVLAGPFDGSEGWRGLFVLAVDDVEQARRIAETDPVLVKGEMVAEYHPWYGTAAVMMIPELHARLAPTASP